MKICKILLLVLIGTVILNLSACGTTLGNSSGAIVYLVTETKTGNYKTTYDYYSNGNLKRYDDGGDWYCQYHYDYSGNLVSAESGDDTGVKYRYEYTNQNGLKTQELCFSADGQAHSRTEYTYSEQGFLIKSTEYRDGEESKCIEYSYNTNGFLVQEIEYRDDIIKATIEYAYNDNNQLVKITRTAGIGDSFFTEYEYDNQGRITKSLTNWGGGETETTYKYKKVRMSAEKARRLQCEWGNVSVIIVR